MSKIERQMIVIGRGARYAAQLPKPLRARLDAGKARVFDLDTVEAAKVVKQLGLAYQEVDLVLAVDTLTTHKTKLFEILSGITDNKTPILNDVYALYFRACDVEFSCDIVRFLAGRNISVMITSATAFSKRHVESQLQAVLSTGPYNVVEMIINRNSVPETQFLKSLRTFMPTDLPETLYKHKIVDERFWYWDEKGAALWLYLKDSRNYAFFRETYEVLQTNVAEIRDAIFESISGNGLKTLDVIAFGVGSAEKELLLLREIMDYYRRKGVTLASPMYYIPTDISFPLLQNSIRILFSDPEVRKYIEQGSLLLRPVLTDFLGVNRHLFGTPNEGRVITALGVLTNVSRRDAFDSWHKLLDDKTLLLIDAELIGERVDQNLIDDYSSDEVFDFLYHPVEMLCAGTGGELFHVQEKGGTAQVPYDYFKPYATGPGSLEVDVVSNDRLDRLETKHGVSEKDIRRVWNLSNAENSKVIVIMLKSRNKDMPALVVGYSIKFSYHELVDSIRKRGFEIVGQYLNNTNSSVATFGYFLLKKAKSNID